MAKVKGICKNIDGCDLAADKVVQEVDSFDFKCSECGKELSPLVEKKKNGNNKLLAIILGFVALLVILGGIFAFCTGGSGEPQDPVVNDTIAPVDTMVTEPVMKPDTIMTADTVVLRDTIVQRDTVRVPVSAKPAGPAPKPAATSGTKNLGYATFKGSWPNDVNGRMVFKSSHVIDSKDPKGRVAEAGDYVIGEWSDGHLVQGIWYGADNQVKGSVIIGK